MDKKVGVIGAGFAAIAGMLGAGADDDGPVKNLGTFGEPRVRKDKPHMVRVFSSPGRMVGNEGPLVAKPTAAGPRKPLNQVHFKAGAQLLFADGSFRSPGRRRIHAIIDKTGQEVVISGRQLRNLRKAGRRNAKAKAAAAAK